MTFTSNNERLFKTSLVYVTRLQQHPWRVLLATGIFGAIWYGATVSLALFWALLSLAVLVNLPARLFLLAAIIILTLTPTLYFLDRPAQAERAGILVFSLLALGTIVNLIDVWRQEKDARI